MGRILSFVAVLVACAAARAAGFSDEELAAVFPYDLGPDTVDVSKYPKGIRDPYPLFQRACGKCHGPARALNSPIIKRADWERYVLRMHIKGKAGGVDLSKADAKAILDFLAYDSQERKVKDSKAFKASSRRLEARFREMKAERARRQREEGAAKAKPPAPYTGTKP